MPLNIGHKSIKGSHDSTPYLKHEYQVDSCSIAFCCYSLFLNLAAEDTRTVSNKREIQK